MDLSEFQWIPQRLEPRLRRHPVAMQRPKKRAVLFWWGTQFTAAFPSQIQDNGRVQQECRRLDDCCAENQSLSGIEWTRHPGLPKSVSQSTKHVYDGGQLIGGRSRWGYFVGRIPPDAPQAYAVRTPADTRVKEMVLTDGSHS